MTLEEDVALLREEVDHLRVIDRDKSRRLEDLESQVAVWNVNGAENLLGGYGFTKIGNRVYADDNGLQVLLESPGEATRVQGILFTDSFQHGAIDFDTTTPPWGHILAISQASAMSLLLAANFNDPTAESSPTVARASLESATDYALARVGPVLYLEYGHTSDPTAGLADGEIWYRSDTDKFRGRANGATDNLAMEAWVTANTTSIGLVIALNTGYGEF